jgi:membrane-associated phospholipid phosphatase
MAGRVRWWLVPWLLVAAAGQVVAFELVRRFFVGTARGQRIDTAALAGNSIGRRHIEELIEAVLGAMTVASLLTATLVIGFIALIRRRVVLALLATALILGANLTTQLLKVTLTRPEFGIDLARLSAGNSLPSGHTTVAVSVAVALVLVLPARLGTPAALAGAGYAALAGVATLAAGWHRPSDAVAAVLVVGGWAALIAAVLAVSRRPGPRMGSGAGSGAGLGTGAGTGPGSAGVPAPGRLGAAWLGLLGAALLVAALVAMAATDRATAAGLDLDRGQLFVAYAGGAAGIAAVTCLVIAFVLATGRLLLAQSRPAGG